jgi:hypothetical protein
MPDITFYRQARADGGVRTGIEIDNQTVLSRFEEGVSDEDPSIVWYVDVRFRGTSLPRNALAAREFLIENEKTVRRLLSDLAETIPAGIDPGAWPIRREMKIGSKIKVEVASSAVRRYEASRLADTLRDLAAHWRELVEGLAEVEV